MGQSVPGRLAQMHRAIIDAAPGITTVELRAYYYIADNEGVNQRQVCQHLDMPQASVSRAIANINGDGHQLVECEEQGRQHAIRLSPKGRQLLATLAVLMGCYCVAPASDAILSQWEIEASPENYSHAYDMCADPTVFSCNVS